ncbi:MAG: hypothetical protein ACTHLC_03670, partial [Rhizobiaceae bacterium]
ERQGDRGCEEYAFQHGSAFPSLARIVLGAGKTSSIPQCGSKSATFRSYDDDVMAEMRKRQYFTDRDSALLDGDADARRSFA